FKALDIIISAEEFIFFYEKNIKRNMLDDISKIRFGKNGYIFVNNYDGKALISDGKIIDENINLWNLEDPNGIKVIQEERKAVQNPNGDFIYYSWRKLQDTIPLPKMSFIKGVEEWQWMVGAGVYIDEANKIINQKREILKQQIKKQILIIVSVLLLTFLLILLVYLNITKKAKRNIQNFLSFFKKASNENLYINENKINFQEFKILASSANKMVSNIRKTTAEKEEEEAYFERLFEIAPEAITILDLNGKIKRVNNKFVDLFGFSQNELIGKDVDKMIVPEELFGEARINAEMVLNKDTFISEGIRICKNGKNINVSIIATSIELKQGEIGIYVIYRDITDQKEFENKLNEAKDKAEESDRLKASFLANISHEIRTPMNSILGFSSLLELPDIDQDSKSTYIKHINISGNELLKIIENILALSRLEAKELTINITKCNLSELFNELQFIFIEKKNKDTDFILKKNNSENSVIYTDCRRLKQIMSSFIDNALKFTKEGYIEFGYKILGEKIKFYVKDTGIGLSEDKKKIIFDRFRQVEETHTRKYGGTGLGLSIAKKLVELLNGEIKIESELGKGAEFSFCLPYKQVKKETPNNIENFSPKKFIWKDKKILIAEDEEINFLFIKNILKPTQATLWRAKNGEDVMKIINTDNKPDIILMDIKMPIMTGNEALKEIRKKDINIPVIAQTAYTLDNEQSELLEMGYNDFILKPYSINNLIKIIAKYLS
ncbi:MAG: cache domain-containing protein, partial [Bacteroidota bacterium]|nr:cache domain-containing protein [Bacteroidota bacterium]